MRTQSGQRRPLMNKEQAIYRLQNIKVRAGSKSIVYARGFKRNWRKETVVWVRRSCGRWPSVLVRKAYTVSSNCRIQEHKNILQDTAGRL